MLVRTARAAASPTISGVSATANFASVPHDFAPTRPHHWRRRSGRRRADLQLGAGAPHPPQDRRGIHEITRRRARGGDAQRSAGRAHAGARRSPTRSNRASRRAPWRAPWRKTLAAAMADDLDDDFVPPVNFAPQTPAEMPSAPPRSPSAARRTSHPRSRRVHWIADERPVRAARPRHRVRDHAAAGTPGQRRRAWPQRCTHGWASRCAGSAAPARTPRGSSSSPIRPANGASSPRACCWPTAPVPPPAR